MAYSTFYESVWGVVDVINQSKHQHLQFNEGGANFPSHDEQREIAAAFERMSGADFDNVIGAVDGMLVWTIKPPKTTCDAMDIGQASAIDFAFRKLCGERGNPEALKAGKRGNPDLVFSQARFPETFRDLFGTALNPRLKHPASRSAAAARNGDTVTTANTS